MVRGEVYFSLLVYGASGFTVFIYAKKKRRKQKGPKFKEKPDEQTDERTDRSNRASGNKEHHF